VPVHGHHGIEVTLLIGTGEVWGNHAGVGHARAGARTAPALGVEVARRPDLGRVGREHRGARAGCRLRAAAQVHRVAEAGAELGEVPGAPVLATVIEVTGRAADVGSVVGRAHDLTGQARDLIA